MSVFIGLGANISSPYGPPKATLKAALQAFPEERIRVLNVSRWYASPAYPDPSAPPFTNSVAKVATDLDPPQLLRVLHDVERRFGRIRRAQWEPRPVDLDILDYDGLCSPADRAEGYPDIPHPRMTERAFVLLPLQELAPHWRDPRSGRSIISLIQALPSDQTAEPMDD